ncbi:MAG: patatin-like phospholipase family protein [Acetobacteraceae bacterium]|nr:patatin-like phospholipase family protein [Acetobacteraceae bacterium]
MANAFARRGMPAGKKAMALVLQGGGALGAHEWGAIVRLCEAGFYPIAVTGVSIGAVNAAAIAGAKDGDIIASLNELWRRLTLTAPPFVPDFVAETISAFGHPAMYRLRHDFYNFWSWTAFCEMAPLRETLTTVCDFDQINDENHMGFAVTATDVANGDSKRFLNVNSERITPDHIIASGALPPGFPMALVDGRSYWDGGVFDNTPMAPMLELLEARRAEDVPVVVIELFPGDEEQPLPTNMLELKNRMMELTYQNRFWDDYGGLESLRSYAAMISDLAHALPPDSPVRKNPQFNDGQFKNLLKRRFYRNLHVIKSPHVPLTGGMDFSEKSIMERYGRGRAAADSALQNGLAAATAAFARPDLRSHISIGAGRTTPISSTLDQANRRISELTGQ